MDFLTEYINPKSLKTIRNWEEEFGVQISLSKNNKSRLGVFIPKRGEKNVVRINNNLNKYSFMITLVHELAHASIWIKHKNKVNPHGELWKEEFRKMIFPFLNPEFFPEDILKSLSKHLLNPSATTVRDIELTKILKKYDFKDVITVSEILDGDKFTIHNGQQFIRICKLRKNYKCKEISTHKLYRFSPLSEIIPL